jgi:hypothetical protein
VPQQDNMPAGAKSIPERGFIRLSGITILYENRYGDDNG